MAASTEDETFDYVVARPSDATRQNSRLAIYRFGIDVHHGDRRSADTFLTYVRSQDAAPDWAVYRVSFEKLDI